MVKEQQRLSRSGGIGYRGGRGILLFLALAAATLAQTSSQIESDEVKRVGVHLRCTCGCNDNLNCNMSSGQCPVCKPARTHIFRQQQAGMSDDSIVTELASSGEFTRLSDPNAYFWVTPYFSLALGAGVVLVVLRRLRNGQRSPGETYRATPGHDPEFARYRKAIEMDTEGLDQ
jgi:cytochrome c-type biogenesis protein CcmH/NrfF